MHDITSKEIEKLLTIIPQDYPSMDIFHLTSHCNLLCRSLYDFCKLQAYHYDLMIDNPDHLKELSHTTSFNPHQFYYEKQRYSRQGKSYDFVFIDIDLNKIEDEKLFFKKLYSVNKNGGIILFIIKNSEDLHRLEETLIENNYVAVNSIVDTFENYHIISARKMHGWGTKVV